MKPSDSFYSDLGGNRVVPESPLDVDVIRQAILPDRWDLSAVPRAHWGGSWPNLCRFGGQALYHPDWSPDFLVHYELREHLGEGFFDLQVVLHGKALFASFRLLAALVFADHPPFQSGWQGVPRQWFLGPRWFLAGERADPRGLQLKTDVAQGPLLLDALSAVSAESQCLPPHVLLVDPQAVFGFRKPT